MNKLEFLDQLKSRLNGINEEEVNKSLAYYSEMIDDRVEDGLTEEQAIEQIGTPKKIAEQILMEVPLTKLVKEKFKKDGGMTAMNITLLAIGSPIWVSLLISAIAIIASLYAVAWSLVISYFAVGVSLGATAVAGFFLTAVYFVQGNIGSALFVFGAGLLLIGLTILSVIGSKYIVKAMIWLSKKIWLGIKSCFVKRGATK